jgi:DNA-binding helix-hairpin-helix protein with protein kinase domain
MWKPKKMVRGYIMPRLSGKFPVNMEFDPRVIKS